MICQQGAGLDDERKSSMEDAMTLPLWLDHLLFKNLNAKYCRSNSNMVVIDWDQQDMLTYLGTYFPRSYVEAYQIFSDHFTTEIKEWKQRTAISIFGFGSGTGGEIIGLLMAIQDKLPCVKSVRVFAFDGNDCALRLFEKVLDQVQQHLSFQVASRILPFKIDDFYDLSLLDNLIKEQFDIIVSFKAICEFVTKERFEESNAYTVFFDRFLPKIKTNGIMLLADVTTYNNVSQEWLPTMMDEAIKESHANLISQNQGFNQVFEVIHSRVASDRSKLAWRLIQNNYN